VCVVVALGQGWWDDTSPAHSSHDDVRVTSFVRYGNSTLLAVASWAATNLTVTIEIDWSTLGLDASKATVLAPALAGVQPQAKFNIAGTSVTLPVEAAGGWLLVVR
jgi:hypothetical protein